MEEFYLDSCGAGRLHCALWKPEGEPKAVVQLIHGIAEHIGRYDAFAKFLTQHGYVVAADDHMGHGGSAENGLRGYFSGGWLSAVEDEKRLHDEISAQYPDLPYYILGHSMGSFLLRTYLYTYQPSRRSRRGGLRHRRRQRRRLSRSTHWARSRGRRPCYSCRT